MTAATTTDIPRAPATVSWQIEPKGIFSRHFDLFQNGQRIVTLHLELWRDGCSFTIAGHEFSIRKPSLWKDEFHLLAEGKSFCKVKRNFWSRRFALVSADEEWILQPAAWYSTNYQLLAGGTAAGLISRANWWSRRRVATFASDVPPPIQVLAIFLVLIVARRQANAH